MLQTNFTAGEISPRAYGRVDVQRYMNGAESLLNCISNIHGGAERRPGTVIEGEARYADRQCILIPFVYSTSEAYVIELGDRYMRVYRAGGGQITAGGAVYEISTPYPHQILHQIDYTQGVDTMFLMHEDYPVHQLRRLAEDVWQVRATEFTTEPFAENGVRPPVSISVSSVNPGPGVTASTGGDFFRTADVGRMVTWGTGRAEIVSVYSGTQALLFVIDGFSTDSAAAGAWIVEGSPQAELKPSSKGTVGQVIDLSFNAETSVTYGPTLAIAGIAWGGGTAGITAAGHGLSVGDNVQIRGVEPEAYNGTFVVTGVPGANQFQYSVPSNPGDATQTGTARAVYTSTSATTGWRGDDAGRFVRINRGLVKIQSVTDATVARGLVITDLDADVSAPASAWTLESSVWNEHDGYPRTGCFYEQRLCLAATRGQSQTIWGSRSGLFFDFTIGTEDDDAFSFSLPPTGQINPISQLLASSVLVPLTFGGEYTMAGGVEKPLAPTNVQCKPRTTYGCTRVKPVRVGQEILFIQRSGRKVRALSYDPDTARYSAPDLTVISEHISEPSIVGMAYQAEPRSLVWAVCGDGTAAVLSLDRDEGVVAWTHIETQGRFESFACVPAAGGDETWALVSRTINGQTRRFIERFVDGQYLDCAITGTSAEPAMQWGGLQHLNGERVTVRGDGTYMGEYTVSGGSVTLSHAVQQVQVGLPFTVRVKLLAPEVMSQIGTMQGAKIGAHKLSLLMLEGQGVTINGDHVEFRTFDASTLDSPPDILRAGWMALSQTGWFDGKLPVEIVQDQPYPFHLLAVVRDFQAN